MRQRLSAELRWESSPKGGLMDKDMGGGGGGEERCVCSETERLGEGNQMERLEGRR